MARAALTLLLGILLPVAALADTPLTGRVADALTLEPVQGAEVTLAATGETTRTDAQGRYTLLAPEGTTHVVEIAAAGHHGVRLVNQGPDRTAEAHLLPTEAPADLAWRQGEAPLFGVPHDRALARAIPGGEVRLPPGLRLARPTAMPARIRVARYFSSSCAGSYSRIDELAFEDYVAGVVPSEIGVFKSVPGGPEVSRASFETFAVLARTYALWFYLSKGADADYHLNDTACNQRYEDARDAFISEAVQDTAGLILVKAADTQVIDKFEYAASCGRNGTRPEYQTTLVPDVTGVHGCTTGGWCGHDSCAAHEDNPAVPGTDRCLVRGTCQWGSLEWSMGNHDRDFILDHYEPNLTVADLGADPRGNLVGVVREGAIQGGADIVGATVTLDTGATATTNEAATFRFDGVPYGTYTLTASAPGYVTASRSRVVEGPGDHWASIALERAAADGGTPEPDAGTPEPDAGPADDAGTPDDAGTLEDGGPLADGGLADGGGPLDDGGQGDGDDVVQGGCGCATTGIDGNRLPLVVLLGLGLWWVRRISRTARHSR